MVGGIREVSTHQRLVNEDDRRQEIAQGAEQQKVRDRSDTSGLQCKLVPEDFPKFHGGWFTSPTVRYDDFPRP